MSNLARLVLTNCVCLIDSQTAGSSGSCHLRELDLCGASLLVSMHSADGFAATDKEIDKQCVNMSEAGQCFRNYTRRCMTPLQRQIVTFSANGTIDLASEYCRKGSAFRSNYLKHAKCLNLVQKKEQKGCLRDLQAALEIVSTTSTAAGLEAGRRLALACCAYKRFESCFGDQLHKRCGKETSAFVQSTFGRATSKIPETICQNYKADSNECRTLLPKSGSAPKGAKSNSIVSRLITAYSKF